MNLTQIEDQTAKKEQGMEQMFKDKFNSRIIVLTICGVVAYAAYSIGFNYMHGTPETQNRISETFRSVVPGGDGK